MQLLRFAGALFQITVSGLWPGFRVWYILLGHKYRLSAYYIATWTLSDSGSDPHTVI